MQSLSGMEGSGWGRELPTEVLEIVLSQLPLCHLLSVAATVCHHWAAIIRNPAFLPWKKLYHQAKVASASLTSKILLCRYLAEEKMSAGELVEALCDSHSINTLSSCLIKIIRLMGSVHRKPRQDATPTVLSHHPLYSAAMATLQQIDPALLPRPHNIWHVATTIIILCHDVWQVEAVLGLLLHQGSTLNSCEVVEAFYCLATFLFHCTRKLLLPNRYHYIVYYALYLYENSWASAPIQDPGILQKRHLGQQSLTRFLGSTSDTRRHTHEQMRIINHDIQPDHVVKIVAFAGTGKTTTLLQLCKQRPHQRFLLVVYNKSVQEHCSRCFPRNTTTRTAHSLSFASVGRRYAAINKLDFNINASKVASFLEKKDGAGNRYRRAALVKNTVEQFLNSADETLTLRHVPVTHKKERLDDDFRLKILLPDAENVWNEMKKCSHGQQLSMTQDGQLKQWQLYKPKLGGYDIIMVDEAQDMNAAMFDIFLRQSSAKVIVGDPYQQIYSFRGAVNALAQVPASHTFHLTQSFRFGPEVGYMAHCVLEGLLGVHSQTLVGGRYRDTVSSAPDPNKYLISQDGHGRIQDPENIGDVPPNVDNQPGQAAQSAKISPTEEVSMAKDSSAECRKKRMRTSEWGTKKQVVQRAYLARTNLMLYRMSLCLCKDKNFDTASMTFAGGIDRYGLDTVMDVYKLSQVAAGYGTAETLGIKNKLIAKFGSVPQLKKFAENLDDIELLNKIMMYEHSGSETPKDVALLMKRCGGKYGQPDITFTTIHKAKGLEWTWVILMDDLYPCWILEPASADDIGDEHNLLYVAITRAKRFLTLNTAALYTLIKAREKLERLVPRETVVEGTRCVQCGSSTVASISHPLVTQVVPLQLSYHGDCFPGGYLCHTCASFNSFIPPITKRYHPEHLRFISDTSRVARRMLIEGKACENGQEMAISSNMERGWHNYALRNSRERPPQDVNPQVVLNDPAFLIHHLEEGDRAFFDEVEAIPEVIQID